MPIEVQKGHREDEIAHDIDLDLSRLFSQVNVLKVERPGHPGSNSPGHEPDIEECCAYIMERLRNLDVSWDAPLKSICGA